jgi:phospholipid/cholesterol/gamma-HCH transport system substrate-binding protein
VKIPHKVLGVAFICLLLSGVWFTHAIFSKTFVNYDRVTLQTSRIGLQLPERADVKVRGVIVGEVLDFQPTADGAQITLGLYPDEVGTIPSNVTGSILPKTLFGEKYVSLEIPAAPDSSHIVAGDVIHRTDVSIEVEEVLADIYPLLTTVQPADINRTLNAIATALEGRGNKIGENIQVLDAYLKRINPQIPALIADLRLTSKVSNVYAGAMPQIAQILRNTVTTGNTLKGREARLRQLFVDVSAFSDTATTFLADNGDNIIRLGQVSAASTAVFAKYAPEYPCLLKGIVKAGKLQAQAFRGFTLHINLETLPNQPLAYTPADRPRNGDKRGPHCGSLPNPPWTQSNPWTNVPNVNDGVDSSTGKGTDRVAPGFANGPVYADGSGYAGSPQESAILKTMLGPALGLSADDVDDLAVLLIAPMARGAEVSLR